jgi:hypothetical protein
VRGPIVEGRLDLIGHLRWQNLSVSRQYDVRMFGGDLQLDDVPRWYPRFLGYSDVFTAVIGAETPESNRLRYGGRLVVQSGAVSAAGMSPMTPAPWNVGANGGAEIRLADHFVLAGVYGLTVFAPTDSSESDFDPLARLTCVEEDYAIDACGAARQGRAIPTAAGSYTRFEHSFQLSIRYDTL